MIKTIRQTGVSKLEWIATKLSPKGPRINDSQTGVSKLEWIATAL